MGARETGERGIERKGHGWLTAVGIQTILTIRVDAPRKSVGQPVQGNIVQYLVDRWGDVGPRLELLGNPIVVMMLTSTYHLTGENKLTKRAKPTDCCLVRSRSLTVASSVRGRTTSR